jgi:hypothetical protein
MIIKVYIQFLLRNCIKLTFIGFLDPKFEVVSYSRKDNRVIGKLLEVSHGVCSICYHQMSLKDLSYLGNSIRWQSSLIICKFAVLFMVSLPKVQYHIRDSTISCCASLRPFRSFLAYNPCALWHSPTQSIPGSFNGNISKIVSDVSNVRGSVNATRRK